MGKESRRRRARTHVRIEIETDVEKTVSGGGATAPSAPAAPAGAGLSSRARWGLTIAIFLIAFAAFGPALRQGFVDWDDDRNFLQNEAYRGLSGEHLRWMFTTTHVGHWQPLSWVSLALDWQLWELDGRGYHFTSMWIHGLNAVLFYLLALGLLRRTQSGSAAPPARLHLTAAAAALLFAVHPLRVESVAWATERRDVLSAFFLLVTLLVWLRALEPGRAGAYLLALLAFALSLLSKAWGITLPAVLLVLDVWPLRRWRGSGGTRGAGALIVEKLPFFALAAAAAAGAFVAQRAGEGGQTALLDLEHHGVIQRLAQAAFGLTFYVQKTVLPTGLSPLYELELQVDPTRARYLLSAAFVLVLTAVLFLLRRRWPAGLATWLTFAIVVSPVLGLLQSGAQSAADRYTYLACLPFALLAAAGLARLAARTTSAGAVGVGVVVMTLLFGLTWRQTRVWRDSETLWRHVVATQPESYVGHFNLAATLHKAGRMDEARESYRRSVESHPGEGNDQARLQLARLQPPQARVALLEEGLAVDPQTWTLIQELTPFYRSSGRGAQLALLWQRGVAADPGDYQGPFLLGDELSAQGRTEEAIASWLQALEIADGDPPMSVEHRAFAWVRIAQAQEGRARLTDAEDAWRQAWKLQAADLDVALGLAANLVRQGRGPEAGLFVQRVLSTDPGNARAREIQAAIERGR